MDELSPRPLGEPRAGWSWWNLLLILPFIALLWVPFFNFVDPTLWGIPFFYWYQFLWVFLTSGLIIFVHHRTDSDRSGF